MTICSDPVSIHPLRAPLHPLRRRCRSAFCGSAEPTDPFACLSRVEDETLVSAIRLLGLSARRRLSKAETLPIGAALHSLLQRNPPVDRLE